jgi:hypothetical protein
VRDGIDIRNQQGESILAIISPKVRDTPPTWKLRRFMTGDAHTSATSDHVDGMDSDRQLVALWERETGFSYMEVMFPVVYNRDPEMYKNIPRARNEQKPQILTSAAIQKVAFRLDMAMLSSLYKSSWMGGILARERYA